MPIEKKLESLLIGNKLFSEIEKQFDVFCPFESMGVLRAEIRHGSFLSFMLNPFRPHGFGSRILRALLMVSSRSAREYAPLKAELSPLDVHLLELDDADVRREWRNIDLLISLRRQKVVIAIELKIDSSQHGNQLLRYRNTVQNHWSEPGWKHIYIFLTKYDEEPDDPEFWIPVRLRDLTLELESVLDGVNADSDAEAMLRSYVRMLRRNHLSDERLEEISRKLWSEHHEALDFLMSRRPDALADVFSWLGANLELIASENCSELGSFVTDTASQTIVRVAFKPWDSVPGFLTSRWTDSRRLILFEIKREGARVSAFMYLGPGTTDDRQYFSNLLKDKRLHRPGAKVGDDWMCIAKSVLFELRDGTDFEEKDAIKNIRSGFSTFLKKCVSNFDPIIRKPVILNE